jgi:hypothetical protein
VFLQGLQHKTTIMNDCIHQELDKNSYFVQIRFI